MEVKIMTIVAIGEIITAVGTAIKAMEEVIKKEK
ncbi:hypothetical protein M2142_001900 [Fusobacterium sp. PH5-29]